MSRSSTQPACAVIDTEMPLADARDGFDKMLAGDTAGKIVFSVR